MADPHDEGDSEITDAVRLAPEKDPTANSDQIRVSMRNADVTPQGQVTTESEREAAEFDASYIFGVDEVVNRLLVGCSGRLLQSVDPDQAIVRAVALAGGMAKSPAKTRAAP